MAVCFIAQIIMTVRSGGSVTSCVKIVLGHTTVAVVMDTSWSRVMSAKPMCQVWGVTDHTIVLFDMYLLLHSMWGVSMINTT